MIKDKPVPTEKTLRQRLYEFFTHSLLTPLFLTFLVSWLFQSIFAATNFTNTASVSISTQFLLQEQKDLNFLLLLQALLSILDLKFSSFIQWHVNEESCTCDCWDRKFKGTYFNSRHQYKSVYFNLESTTSWLLFLVLFYAVASIDGLRYGYRVLSSCAISAYQQNKSFFRLVRKEADLIMALAVLFTIFPNFYSFWAHFNYMNDRIFNLWWTQLFFTVTEFLISITCYSLIDKTDNSNQPHTGEYFLRLWTCLTIEIMHIFEMVGDQMISNLKGTKQERINRDISLLVSDIGVVACLVYRLYQAYTLKPEMKSLFPKHLIRAAGFFIALVLFFNFILKFMSGI